MSNVSLGTATFYITGNASGATNAANQANNALASLSSSVGRSWWGLQNLGLAFAALPSAVAAGAGAAVKSAIEWQDAMFDLARATGDSDAAVAQIGDEILNLAKRIPIATSELAALASEGATLGIANENLASFAETMGGLIATTNVTTANVGDFARVINVLQVPEEQFQNFANTLIEVGRNTAASETEILNITKRMSGAGAVAGITADQLLGIGAAMISLGPRAEAGGTAFNKTITDMTRAVANGSDELETFAAISNKSVEQFKADFQNDAAKAFADFITGLVRLKGGALATNQALDALGITESRQRAALLQLAQGTLDVGSKQRDLNAILGFSASAYANSTAGQDLMEKKAQTLSGQIQLLKNSLFETGAIIGKYLIPFVAFAVQRFQDFIVGVASLPGPLKFVAGILIALVTAVTAVAAAFLLIGPRVAQAVMAFQRLTGSAGGAAGGVAAAGASASASIPGISALTTAVINLTLAMMRAEGASYNAMRAVSAVGTASAASGAAQNIANTTGALGGLTGAASKFGKAAGWIGLGLTAVGLATTYFGNRTRKSTDAAQEAEKANKQMADSLKKQNDAAKKAAASMADLGDEEDGVGGSTDKANKALRKQIELLTQMATAQSSLVDAQEQQRQAQSQLIEAQISYQKALDDQAHSAEAIQNAELDVEKARWDVASATDDLAAKEEALGNVRADVARQVKEAERDLADARDREVDSAQEVADLEERINDLRGGDASLELIKQTNALRDAQLSLQKAETTVADAEWNLQHLREEGASARDIADAEMALAEARLAASEASTDEADEQKKLTKLKSGEVLADAERDLAKARRDQERAADAVLEKEQDLADLRERQAKDTDYIDAQRDIGDAQKRVADAIIGVRDAQRALDDLRGGSLDREVIKAQDELESAILGVAKANVEVKREMALARGETFDAADAAHALGDELANLANLAPTQEAVDRLNNFASALKNAKNIPDAPDDSSGGGFNPKSMGFDPAVVDTSFDALNQKISDNAAKTKKHTEFSVGGAVSGGLTGAMLGAQVASVIPGVGTAVGAVVGGIIGLFVGGFGAKRSWQIVQDTVGKALKWATSGSGITKAVKAGLITAINPALGAAVIAVDLKNSGAGKAVTGFFSDLFKGGEDSLAKFKSLANKYQESIQTSYNNAVIGLQRAFATGSQISQAEATNIIGHINNMRDQTVAGVNQMADQRIKRIMDLRDRTTTITGEEAAKIIQHINDERDQTIAAENQRSKEIADYIQSLRDKGVNVTAEMVASITQQFTDLRDQSVARVAETKEQQEALLAALAVSTGQITEGEKNHIIKQAKERRDNVIQAARDQADQTIQEAYRGLKAGDLTNEQFKAIVNEANTTRDTTIRNARETANETISNAQRMADEVPGKARTAAEGVRGAFGDMKNEANRRGGAFDISDIGGLVIESLKRGLNAALPGLGTVLGGVGKFIADHKGPKSYDLKLLTPAGRWIIQGLISGLEDEQRNLEKKLSELSGMMEDGLAKTYLSSFSGSVNPLAGSGAALTAAAQAGSIVQNFHDTLNLDAITTADPAEIVNEYVWAKRVRIRGAKARA